MKINLYNQIDEIISAAVNDACKERVFDTADHLIKTQILYFLLLKTGIRSIKSAIIDGI